MADTEEESLPVEVSDTGEPLESVASENETPRSSLQSGGATADSNLLGNGSAPAVVKDSTKIDVYLKATGNAPIMKRKKWTVGQDQHIGWISEFIKKYLKLDPSERLFLYINQTFAPAPDQTVKNLYDCYGIDGKLVIHYCKSHAWG